MLGVTQVSVNRALHRARQRLERAVPPGQRDVAPLPGSREERDLVARLTAAFEAGDVPGVLALLSDDSLLTMPPEPQIPAERRPEPVIHATRRPGQGDRRSFRGQMQKGAVCRSSSSQATAWQSSRANPAVWTPLSCCARDRRACAPAGTTDVVLCAPARAGQQPTRRRDSEPVASPAPAADLLGGRSTDSSCRGTTISSSRKPSEPGRRSTSCSGQRDARLPSDQNTSNSSDQQDGPPTLRTSRNLRAPS